LVQSDKCFYADSNFFTLFSFPLYIGNPNEVLASRNNIVLSKSYSKVLFADENPIGKKVIFNNRLEYTVSGIAEDFGAETHFMAVDVIFPFGAMGDFMGVNNTYLEQYDLRFMMPALYVVSNSKINKNVTDQILTDVKTWYWLFKDDPNATLSFQPLKEVYLNEVSYGYGYNVRSGNSKVLKLTMFIILAVSFIAFVNYINLTISKANSRLREVAVKRINGANNKYLIISLLSEQLLIVAATLLLFCFMLFVSIPFFNQLLAFQVSFSSLLKQAYVLNIIGLFAMISVLIGTAVLLLITLSSVQRGINNKDKGMSVGLVQKGLVVLQYSLSIALIISMLLIVKQKRFIANYDLGFNKSETLFIKLNREFVGKAEVFKDELTKITGVNSVSLCNGMPGMGISDLRFEQNGELKKIDLFHIDTDYFKTMGFKSEMTESLTENSCYINESASIALGYTAEKGTIVIEEYNELRELNVLGILPDMNFHSLYEKARPTIFSKIYTDRFIDYILLNIDPSKTEHILKESKTVYGNFSTNFPFNYSFLNDKINQAYVKESQTLKLITWFSAFGIILSSLGMLSLALILINKKTKEIGIRKVNGAKIFETVQMLNANFIKWVSIAFIIACPIAYFVMNKWLQNFACKTELSWWVFALAGCLALLIALITVSWQTYRAARRNPVEALRYE
jgi:putative ABC transport system permease protein